MMRRAGALLAVALAILLGGCLLSPGKFAATLDLRKGGAFTFTYDGEIHLLALSKLAQKGVQAGEAFTAERCFNGDFDERECTAEELAEQRRTWDRGAAERQAKKAQEAEAARAMFGGIDPADPAAADELAARLRRQAGWERVDHKGDGLFEVRFELTGEIGHDFRFPTIEGLPLANFFVAITRRADDTVRIDAPGFAPQASGNPFQGMIAAMGGVTMPGTERGPSGPALPKIDGTFTITTDGDILANNTDEGPGESTNGKSLIWKVDVRTRAAPTALIGISQAN